MKMKIKKSRKHTKCEKDDYRKLKICFMSRYLHGWLKNGFLKLFF